MILIKVKTHLVFISYQTKQMETLKKNFEFKNVLTKGKYFSGKYIVVYLKKNNSNKNRVGIAVSSKIAKAVKRNKIKRLIRENYKNNYKRIEEGYDIVFLWKKNVDIEKATFYNIKEDIENIFERSNLVIK